MENEIADLAFTTTKQLGLPFGRWTCKRMAKYFVDTGKLKHISREKVRQILNKKRISFKKAKLHIASPDDQYEVKKRIEDFKANYPANSVILYEDEYGPLNLKTQLTKSWSPVGKPQKVEDNTPNVGSINLFCAYDYRTG